MLANNTFSLKANTTLLCFLWDASTGLCNHLLSLPAASLMALLIRSAREIFKTVFHTMLLSVPVHTSLYSSSGSYTTFQFSLFTPEPTLLCFLRKSSSQTAPLLQGLSVSSVFSSEVPKSQHRWAASY